MIVDILPFPIFPHGSLRESVITTVWLGVIVVSFFNLRLGWSASGLVVPGYLVPLLLNKPISAGVVILEGVLTYFLVYFLSDYASKYGIWSRLFGRDRFFALFIGSVAVRLILDGWFLPELGNYLVNEHGFRLDYQSDLHSFGTIIVALIANFFWKTGFLKGVVPFFVNLSVTFFLTRYVLMEFTNFNIGGLFYLYEDVALSFYASPKAYMVLIIAAFFASRVNLHFGWDFNGILLPALLALQWYQPLKILTSLFEAGVVVTLAHGFLSLPMIKESSFEGAKKIMLFFNLSFLYKFILGYLIVWISPQLHITDYYGFGYLLPSLLAIKIYDKAIPFRVGVATVITSFSAAIFASIFGFALTLMPISVNSFFSPTFLSTNTETQLPKIKQITIPLSKLAQRIKVKIYDKRKKGSMEIALAWELEVFSQAMIFIKEFQGTGKQEILERARILLKRIHFEVIEANNNYLIILEDGTNRGWGTYFVRKQMSENLLIEVLEPIKEWNVLESGVVLFEELRASTLAFAGASLETNPDGSSNLLVDRNLIFYKFHSVFSDHNVLQVRAYTRAALRKFHGVRTETDVASQKSGLWVHSNLPTGLKLSELKSLLGSFNILWKHTPERNALRDKTGAGFAELWLNREDRKKLLFKPLLKSSVVNLKVESLRIDGYLQEWLLGSKQELAPRGSNEYKSPSLRQMLYFENEILLPLLALVRSGFRAETSNESETRELSAINLAAGVLNYQISWYRHAGSGREYLILSEQNEQKNRKFWGTYVFRINPDKPFVVQVPRPISEHNSFEVGVSIFEDTGAEALLIAGAHRFANLDASSDLLLFDNRQNIFNLVNQTLIRTSGDKPLLILHSRAYKNDPVLMPEKEILLSSSSGISPDGARSKLVLDLLEELKRANLTYSFQDGSEHTSGYEASNLVQSRYLEQVKNKELVVLWLSPLLRLSYRQQTENRRQNASFEHLDIKTTYGDLFSALASYTHYPLTPLPNQVRRLVTHYVRTQDIIALAKVKKEWTPSGLTRFIDRNSKQAFLLLEQQNGTAPFVANLNPRSFDLSTFHVQEMPLRAHDVKSYIFSGKMWLIKGEDP